MTGHIKISIEKADSSILEIVIALLSEAGFDGFEEQDESLHGFIPQENFDETIVKNTLSPFGLTYSIEIIESKNWNEEWEKNFEPVIIENFCAIRATFHKPITSVQHEIIITPKMSFGTGHHDTTWRMIYFMRKINFNQKNVLDFGTGTGILAILAEKLNAEQITAIDNDYWSITNAQENIIANHCTRINIVEATSIFTNEKYDVILANINKHVILANLLAIKQHLTTDGVVLLSGLLGSDKDEISMAVEKNHFTILDQSEKNKWLALLLTHNNQ